MLCPMPNCTGDMKYDKIWDDEAQEFDEFYKCPVCNHFHIIGTHTLEEMGMTQEEFENLFKDNPKAVFD
jgi:hypothetical protein